MYEKTKGQRVEMICLEVVGFTSGDASLRIRDSQASELPTLPCGVTQEFESAVDERYCLLPVLNPGAALPKYRIFTILQSCPIPELLIQILWEGAEHK